MYVSLQVFVYNISHTQPFKPQFYLVKSAEDVEDGPCFYPEMSHQVFGSR